MADDEQFRICVLFQARREGTQVQAWFQPDRIRIEVVQEARSERDLDTFPDALDRRARYLERQFFRLLVRLMADDGPGGTAHDGTNDGASRGRSGVLTDHTPGGTSCGSPDNRAFFLPTHRCTRTEREDRAGKQ